MNRLLMMFVMLNCFSPLYAVRADIRGPSDQYYLEVTRVKDGDREFVRFSEMIDGVRHPVGKQKWYSKEVLELIQRVENDDYAKKMEEFSVVAGVTIWGLAAWLGETAAAIVEYRGAYVSADALAKLKFAQGAKVAAAFAIKGAIWKHSFMRQGERCKAIRDDVINDADIELKKTEDVHHEVETLKDVLAAY